jgi:hypothetical protein
MRAPLLLAVILLGITLIPMSNASTQGCTPAELTNNRWFMDSWTTGYCTFTFQGLKPNSDGTWYGLLTSFA